MPQDYFLRGKNMLENYHNWRREKLLKIEFGEEAVRKMLKEEQRQIEERSRRLGINIEDIRTLEYSFGLPKEINFKEEDEERVRRILQDVGNERYHGEPFRITGTDSDMRHFEGGWVYLTRIWPPYDVGWIETVNVRNNHHFGKPSEVIIGFATGEKDKSEDAMGIYKDILRRLK